MDKLVCYFSGWCEASTEDVKMTDPQSGEVKTAKEWINEKADLDNLILDSFADMNAIATDGEYEELRIELE